MRATRFILFSSLVLVAACGGDSPTDSNNNNNNTGPVSGKINNVNWSSTAAAALTYTAASHTYAFSAGDLTGRAMAVVLSEITAAGTYPVGTGVPFRYANVAINGLVWESSVTSGTSSGSVVIDIATSTRLKGHLVYTGTPAASSPGATGTAAVDVTFDLTVTSSN